MSKLCRKLMIGMWLMAVCLICAGIAVDESKAAGDASAAAFASEGSLERNLFSIKNNIGVGATISGKVNDHDVIDSLHDGFGPDYGVGASIKLWDNVRLTGTAVSASGLSPKRTIAVTGNDDEPRNHEKDIEYAAERDYRLRATVVVGF